jgi:hypothetical protein
MDDTLARARLLELRLDPLPDVGVRPVPIAREIAEDRAQLADPFGSFFADQPALDHLHLRAMRHGHRVTFLSSIREGARTGARGEVRVLSRRFPGRWCRKRRTSRAGYR